MSQDESDGEGGYRTKQPDHRATWVRITPLFIYCVFAEIIHRKRTSSKLYVQRRLRRLDLGTVYVLAFLGIRLRLSNAQFLTLSAAQEAARSLSVFLSAASARRGAIRTLATSRSTAILSTRGSSRSPISLLSLHSTR